MPLSVGDKLGPYEILAPIGAGGMGEVWKARDTRLDRIVAIKTSSEKFSERFEREARAIAALNHPNICQIYDVGPDYLVMEYIDGGDQGSAAARSGAEGGNSTGRSARSRTSQIDHPSRPQTGEYSYHQIRRQSPRLRPRQIRGS